MQAEKKARNKIDSKIGLGINLSLYTIHMVCVVNNRGRVYEGRPLPLWTTHRLYQSVRWMPEDRFMRADLYRSGPHVGTTILQRKKFPTLPKGKTYGGA